MSDQPTTPIKVFATVGTDHHRFDRLVDWADRLRQAHPNWVVFVQYGTSRAPAHACGSAYLTWAEMEAQMSEAHVVITHGGPGCMNDARRWSHVPICVPREPEYGEHVDAHQVRFCSFMAAQGLITLARTEPEMIGAVAERVSGPSVTFARLQAAPPPTGVVRFVALMEELAGSCATGHRRLGARLKRRVGR